jgi:hypothetical protein
MAIALTCRVDPFDSTLRALSDATARAAGRPARALHLQALLQLPRLTDEQGGVPVQLAGSLVSELAAELPPTSAWVVPIAERSPRSLRFSQLSVAEVHDAMRSFHYLRSPRMDGRAYGVNTRAGHLVAFCVSSPLDVPHLGTLLARRGRPAGPGARVLSRVFAFAGAPPNTLSYLLAKAAHRERGYGVTELVTYVNPNLGFTGTSYRASGWRHLGDEPGTQYHYLDTRYVTDRALAAAFGRHPDTVYRQLLGDRFAVSVMVLAPLLVFHRQVA